MVPISHLYSNTYVKAGPGDINDQSPRSGLFFNATPRRSWFCSVLELIQCLAAYADITLAWGCRCQESSTSHSV